MRIFACILAFVLITTPSWAATIHLRSGQVVEGNITKINPKNLKVEVNGVVMTYFAEEIADIDGNPFPSPRPPAQVSQPNQPAETIGTITPQKRELILKFIDVFGTRQALQENFDAMLKQIPARQSKEAAQLKERIKIDELIERLVPIYDRQFSQEDLESFVNFYTSDAGKKLLKKIPILMQESVDTSANYIEEKFPTATKPGKVTSQN